MASLSSIYSFYKDLGIITSNPFKAIEVPIRDRGHHSAVMTMDQLVEVWRYVKDLKKEGIDVELTVKSYLLD